VFIVLASLSNISGPKLMQENSKYRKDFQQHIVEISLIFLQTFGHNFGTRNATQQSIKPYKDTSPRIQSNFEPQNQLNCWTPTECWHNHMFWQTCQLLNSHGMLTNHMFWQTLPIALTTHI